MRITVFGPDDNEMENLYSSQNIFNVLKRWRIQKKVMYLVRAESGQYVHFRIEKLERNCFDLGNLVIILCDENSEVRDHIFKPDEYNLLACKHNQ